MVFMKRGKPESSELESSKPKSCKLTSSELKNGKKEISDEHILIGPDRPYANGAFPCGKCPAFCRECPVFQRKCPAFCRESAFLGRESPFFRIGGQRLLGLSAGEDCRSRSGQY